MFYLAKRNEKHPLKVEGLIFFIPNSWSKPLGIAIQVRRFYHHQFPYSSLDRTSFRLWFPFQHKFEGCGFIPLGHHFLPMTKNYNLVQAQPKYLGEIWIDLAGESVCKQLWDDRNENAIHSQWIINCSEICFADLFIGISLTGVDLSNNSQLRQ